MCSWDRKSAENVTLNEAKHLGIFFALGKENEMLGVFATLRMTGRKGFSAAC